LLTIDLSQFFLKIMKFVKTSTDRRFPGCFDHFPREIDMVGVEDVSHEFARRLLARDVTVAGRGAGLETKQERSGSEDLRAFRRTVAYCW
jgi:hypothetical protein